MSPLQQPDPLALLPASLGLELLWFVGPVLAAFLLGAWWLGRENRRRFRPLLHRWQQGRFLGPLFFTRGVAGRWRGREARLFEVDPQGEARRLEIDLATTRPLRLDWAWKDREWALSAAGIEKSVSPLRRITLAEGSEGGTALEATPRAKGIAEALEVETELEGSLERLREAGFERIELTPSRIAVHLPVEKGTWFWEAEALDSDRVEAWLEDLDRLRQAVQRICDARPGELPSAPAAEPGSPLRRRWGCVVLKLLLAILLGLLVGWYL